MRGTSDSFRTMASLQHEASEAEAHANGDLPFPGRGQGFCLVMKLRYPAQMGVLLRGLDRLTGDADADNEAGADGGKRPQTVNQIDRRLKALKYVHYSRFVPLVDRGELLIVTEFDGNQQDYVLDFAAVLDQEFSFILSFMEDAPPLPVRENPQAFYAYVDRNTKLLGPGQAPDAFFPVGPLNGRSVLDILGDAVFATHDPQALQPASMPGGATAIGREDLADVQRNIVKGFAAQSVRHFLLRFRDDQTSRAHLLRGLSELVTRESEASISHCLNVGLTFEGFLALGLPRDICRRFSSAFQRGPAADAYGYVPGTWPTRMTQEGGGKERVHLVVSLSVGNREPDVQLALEALFEKCASVCSHFDGRRLEDPEAASGADMLVHFGFRDGISQPRIHGIDHGRRTDAEPDALMGDFVLGHPNSRGGDYIGELPAGLARNGTYSAFLIIDQQVDEFDRRAHWKVTPEIGLSENERAALYAEKLLGRKADGRPAHLGNEDGSDPSRNAFDFWNTPASNADPRGSACPFGAHIRRMNPRRGVVVGVPAGRRIIRRGMPYGSRFDPKRPDSESRGLVGHFFCGDLRDQYEFLQRVWGSGDVSAPGLKETRDPFAATRSEETSFKFDWSPSGAAPQTYSLVVPPLVTTRFATYLFLPGKKGLQWLADRSWQMREPREPTRMHHVETPVRVGTIQTPLRIETLDPLDRRFMQTPHRFYAALRSRHVIPVGPPYDSFWALSYQAVQDALESLSVEKPGLGRGALPGRPGGMAAGLKDGLFFQAPARHAVVRRCLNPAFPADGAQAPSISQGSIYPGAGAASLSRVSSLTQAKADELLAAADAKGVFDIVADFAAPLTSHVFMEVMGIPLDPMGAERSLVEAWVRGALAGHDPTANQDLQVGGLTASMALRAYFMALGQCPVQGAPQSSIMDAIRSNTGQGSAGGADLATDEALNTGLHFALGGFLSTQFLITTGTYNLLLNASEWNKLKVDSSPETMERALDEMLRFDSPFMMADRWLPKGVTIAGVRLEAATKLTLVYGSANRDPIHFSNPEKFDISAERRSPHFAFGGASQYNCIGQYMARWVAAAAFRAMIDRFPNASIAEIGPWLTDPYYRSLARLTVYTR